MYFNSAFGNIQTARNHLIAVPFSNQFQHVFSRLVSIDGCA